MLFFTISDLDRVTPTREPPLLGPMEEANLQVANEEPYEIQRFPQNPSTTLGKSSVSYVFTGKQKFCRLV